MHPSHISLLKKQGGKTCTSHAPGTAVTQLHPSTARMKNGWEQDRERKPRVSVRGDSTVCGLRAMSLVASLLRSNGFCNSVSGSLEHHLIECTDEGLGNPRTVLAFSSG